jgi:cobalt/nickel transport system permease protein
MEIFSEYFKKDHILSKIDTRVKLLVSLAILIMVLSYKGFTLPVLITSLCLLLSISMRVPLKIFLLRLSEPLFIALVIVLLKFFFSGKDILFSIPLPSSDYSIVTLTGYKDGLMEGLMIASRILGAVSIVNLISFSTPFTELIAGLSWFRVPKSFIEILMFAYRYIFVLFEDAMVIYNAQKNRLGYCTIKRGLSSFGQLTGSLILKAFDHSQAITLSMMQRGYDGNMPTLKHKPFKQGEVVTSVLIIIAVGILWRM